MIRKGLAPIHLDSPTNHAAPCIRSMVLACPECNSPGPTFPSLDWLHRSAPVGSDHLTNHLTCIRNHAFAFSIFCPRICEPGPRFHLPLPSHPFPPHRRAPVLSPIISLWSCYGRLLFTKPLCRMGRHGTFTPLMHSVSDSPA
ncbi:hypothetical protein CGRA01v4_11839 [Colletotrichum graminicola]|nr:hypothetical protein CGRA01v4_11839 [Colletotrichum graminicola]